jgi:hypothetical protein
MAKAEPMGKGMDLVKKSFADVFASKALGWQLGGAIVAALAYAGLSAIKVQNSFGSLMLAGVAFIVAYVILSATSCLVSRLLDQRDQAEGGVAPLHFLVDNIGSALLLPLIIGVGALLVCVIVYLYFLLWKTDVGQGIAVVFLPVFFVAVLVLILKLFAGLFLGPAMVVKEGLSVGQSLSRLCHVGSKRRAENTKLFGTGLVLTVTVLIPIALVLLLGASVCKDLCAKAQPTKINGFTDFMLDVYIWGLLVAPALTIPFALMNAVTLNSYDDLMGEVEEEAADEEGEAPAGGEEPDVDVEGEGDEAEAEAGK